MADGHVTKVCRDCGVAKHISLYSKKERGILGVRPECNECRSVARRKKYAEDPTYRRSILDKQREAHAANPEKIRQKVREWTLANPERVRHYKRQYREAKPDSVRAWQRKYVSKAKHIINAATARRAASKRNATPKWANKFFIQEAYHLARLRSEMTGRAWHVDHIVPLRSKVVCGLHVENNLQVITARANKLKGNLWWPDMWEPL